MQHSNTVRNTTLRIRPFNNSIESTRGGVGKLGMYAGMFIMTQWTSFLGDTLMNNIANVARVNGTGKEATMRGVSTAIHSMIDKILEACSAAQMVVLEGIQESQAMFQTRNFVLGGPSYIYGVIDINILVTVIFTEEDLRTRWRKNTPRFDFVKLKAVMLNCWVAGNNIVLTDYDPENDEAALNVTFDSDIESTGLSLSKRL